MRVPVLSLLLFALAVRAEPTAAAESRPVSLAGAHPNPIGAFTAYLPERGEPLTLEQAIAAYRAGDFTAAHEATLTFGIGADPVWIRFVLVNPGDRPLSRRVGVETAWLDDVDVHVRHGGATVAHYRFGDRRRNPEPRSLDRGFAFERAFPPGTSVVYVRVATPDPMVVPIRVESPAAATARSTWIHHSYGFLYGYIVALAAYNLVLFASLRQRRYLLYSIYLGAFVLMNLSYTGHAFGWLWSPGSAWAQWSNPTLMMLYASSGLAFALAFLDTRRHFPRVHRGVIGYVLTGLALLAVAVTAGLQAQALLLAFVFVTLFTLIMVGLGVISVRAGLGAARYFLAAAICAMTGAISTAMAVWGAIPYTEWTYRAVDAGMLLDATLLALALSYQFRVAREERERAHELARIDPLTGLYNRRAFHDIASPLWNVTQRHGRDLSVVLMDLDRFKRINDTCGHYCGDDVLRAVAHVILDIVRNQDVVARWGGEEFILLLPETRDDEAVVLAERLRIAVAAQRVTCDDERVAVTASFGVAAWSGHESTLDELIETADGFLLAAKAAGRDRVGHVQSAGVAPAVDTPAPPGPA